MNTRELNQAVEKSTNGMVCILGMHRSGASSLAGCLEERGLYLGKVVNYARYNIKGNKENILLRALNDDVLAFNGGSWDRPPGRLEWNDQLRQRRDECISGFTDHILWGFKDPRTLLTLPFWLEGRDNVSLVGTFRHPQSVVMSMQKRRGLLPETAPLELWKIYNLKLLMYAERLEIPLVCFDWPETTYIRALEEISRKLGLGHQVTGSQGFFDKRLRSIVADPATMHSDQTEEMKVYAALLKRALGFFRKQSSVGYGGVSSS